MFFKFHYDVFDQVALTSDGKYWSNCAVKVKYVEFQPKQANFDVTDECQVIAISPT